MKTEKLIVIDMQADFINKALGTKEAVAIVPIVKTLVEAYKQKNNPIIFTRDTHFENYMTTLEGKKLPVPHCIKNTEGWEINPILDTTDCTIIDKITFGYTNWKDYLSENDTITIVGLCTDICVISNALIIRALYPNATIRIVTDATAGVTEDTKAAALAVAGCCQIDLIESNELINIL